MCSNSSPLGTYSITTKISVGVLITSYLVTTPTRCGEHPPPRHRRAGPQTGRIAQRSTRLRETHRPMTCGWRKLRRFWISRRTFSSMCCFCIFLRFRILTATSTPVLSCSAPGDMSDGSIAGASVAFPARPPPPHKHTQPAQSLTFDLAKRSNANCLAKAVAANANGYIGHG